jgi:hypothetical protein
MPRAAKKTIDIDPDSVYVAWQAGTCDIGGIQHTVVTGQQLRGSDPFVQAHPWLFVKDDVPAGERPTVAGQLLEKQQAQVPPVEYEVALVLEPQPLEREDVRVLARAVTVAYGPGRDKKLVEYEKGTVFNARSELVTAIPSAFEAVDGR